MPRALASAATASTATRRLPAKVQPAISRRLAVGAEPTAEGTSFRVWAPARRRVEVVIEGGTAHELAAEADGYFAAGVPGVGAGVRYWLRESVGRGRAATMLDPDEQRRVDALGCASSEGRDCLRGPVDS